MIRVAVVGIGKMGLSHLAILKAHSDVDLVAVCDSTKYLLSGLTKFTGVRGYSDFESLLATEHLDAVVIATPPASHYALVRRALGSGLAVFCEKPFTLHTSDAAALVEQAEGFGLVNQVGYHYRFAAPFHYLKCLLDAGVIGRVTHCHGEAYGPVVLRAKTGSWRGEKGAGGGALYDYASHVVDLVNYCLGRPDTVSSSTASPIFSTDVEDEVYASLEYRDGRSVQLAVNWSDESQRKMSTKLSIWGTEGKLVADRQELQAYLRKARPDLALEKGWNARYTTDLTQSVDFYLRGEEYSTQIDHFVKAVIAGNPETRSTFRSALQTNEVLSAIREASGLSPIDVGGEAAVRPDEKDSRQGKLLKRVLASTHRR